MWLKKPGGALRSPMRVEDDYWCQLHRVSRRTVTQNVLLLIIYFAIASALVT
jgi:hypothetical protein